MLADHAFQAHRQSYKEAVVVIKSAGHLTLFNGP